MVPRFLFVNKPSKHVERLELYRVERLEQIGVNQNLGRAQHRAEPAEHILAEDVISAFRDCPITARTLCDQRGAQ
jgi:glutamyl-tRNA reductase